MTAVMFPSHIDSGDVSATRALIRAQADIDVEPEKYKHYFINEIPPVSCRRTCRPAAL
jgi:hypothetical protein